MCGSARHGVAVAAYAQGLSGRDGVSLAGGTQFAREHCCIGLVPRGQRFVLTAADQMPRNEAPILPTPMIAVVVGCPAFIIGWLPATDAGQLASAMVPPSCVSGSVSRAGAPGGAAAGGGCGAGWWSSLG